jgi:alanine racemase
MTFRARVLTTRWLEPGERLGYGGRFQNPHSGKRLRIAVLGVGYADGVHRLLSKQGEVYLRGRRVPFLGTISMDLSAVLCPPNAKPGDQAEVIGPHLDLWKQAHAANTIPYELLTAVKPRAIAKATPHR